MLYKKKNLPEENDILICTIKKILPHSVFVDLDEYENKEGLIHISEVSPGRIRNIRDFVKEGKKIVCKVLKVNIEKNQIDLSLRRVNQSQRIAKNQEYKQEQKAEKVLEIIGKGLNFSLQEIYERLGNKLIETYGSIYSSFEKINENPEILNILKIDKNIQESLLKLIKERIKKREVSLSATLIVSSKHPNGIEIIKNVLVQIHNKHQNTSINYISAPKYRLVLISENYKMAERQLAEISEEGVKLISNKGIFKLTKDEKRNT